MQAIRSTVPVATSVSSGCPTTSPSRRRAVHDRRAHPRRTGTVRRFLPELVGLIWDRRIDPGKVFDLALPLDRAAEGYQAMDQCTATKVLLTF